ncbi:TPA: Ail/Lom family outer membrane beta-barrel protein [Escherichia coli]|nr:Ail/Lom family outer membrane beta-barrel protein [Escherichia coli]
MAGKVGSTPGYLRLVFNGYKKASFVLAKKLEQCTSGAITKSDLRPDMAYSRVSTFSGDYLRVTDNKGKTHDVLTGSDDGRHSNTSLAWGAGVQFNPTESVAIDIAYEGSGSGDWRTDGFIVGVGYKF